MENAEWRMQNGELGMENAELRMQNGEWRMESADFLFFLKNLIFQFYCNNYKDMAKENIIQIKSYNFAVRIVNMVKHIRKEHKEYTLSDQVLRSGTSIGANIEEAIDGYSKKDFAAKMSISLKETRETRYWLNLLRDTEYLEQRVATSMLADADELVAILRSIVKSSKENL
jgi:four helix bundle protein